MSQTTVSTHRPASPEPAGDGDSAESTEELRAEVARLRRQVADLRGQVRTHPAIALAQGVLWERYRLSEPDAAFALMRQASQHANIKMHQLAEALIRVPGPDADAQVWFPRRARTAAPPLPALTVPPGAHANQGAVLNAALKRALEITGTDMGNVQLAGGSGLRLEKHLGHPQEFVDFFAFVDGPTTACGKAAADRQQLTVHDVATASLFDEDSRRTILQAGSRACHSVPLIDHQHKVRGMISSHHVRPLTSFTRHQLQALQNLGQAVGRWLSWHRSTVILDALEDLHQHVRTTG